MTAPRTLLISGAARGIGRAIAERALHEGHRLSLGLRQPEVLRGTCLDPAIAGTDRIHVLDYDANDPGAADRWVAAAQDWFGGFDSLIHSAGIWLPTPLLFGDDQSHEPDQLFRIQVLVSMSGKRSKGRWAGYVTSKFALMGLCQTMRNEGWEKGIRVTALCPGWVNTDMVKTISPIAPETMTQPEDLAALSSRLLELPREAVPFELAVMCCPEV